MLIPNRLLGKQKKVPPVRGAKWPAHSQHPSHDSIFNVGPNVHESIDLYI